MVNSEEFGREWIEAWNSHDLEAVLSHYAEEIEFTSPFAVKLVPESGGTLRGKAALREYFSRALEAYPELCFKPLYTAESVRSLVLVYWSVNGLLAAETMELDEEGKVWRVLAHYGSGG